MIGSTDVDAMLDLNAAKKDYDAIVIAAVRCLQPFEIEKQKLESRRRPRERRTFYFFQSPTG